MKKLRVTFRLCQYGGGKWGAMMIGLDDRPDQPAKARKKSGFSLNVIQACIVDGEIRIYGRSQYEG